MVTEFPALFVMVSHSRSLSQFEVTCIWRMQGDLEASHLPGLEELSHGEEGAKEDAEAADDDVGDTEERVSAAHDCTSREQDGLGAGVDK